MSDGQKDTDIVRVQNEVNDFVNDAVNDAHKKACEQMLQVLTILIFSTFLSLLLLSFFHDTWFKWFLLVTTCAGLIGMLLHIKMLRRIITTFHGMNKKNKGMTT